jgi:RNA polymerase sigma-70 factor (ECF subfamily)
MDGLADEALMARIAEGDRAAFAVLVTRHLDRAVRTAQRLLGERSEAEDVAQDAFLRLWQHAGRWRPEGGRFTTWFYRVVVNAAIDRLRRPRPVPIEAVAEPEDEQPNAFRTRHRAEVERSVRTAMAELPERQRTALTLCHYEGLGNIEAAEAMGVTVGALESLLIRAKRHLRDRLRPLMDDLAEDGHEA